MKNIRFFFFNFGFLALLGVAYLLLYAICSPLVDRQFAADQKRYSSILSGSNYADTEMIDSLEENAISKAWAEKLKNSFKRLYPLAILSIITAVVLMIKIYFDDRKIKRMSHLAEYDDD